MNDKAFIDTNIWVYRLDFSDARKQQLATSLLSRLLSNETALISSQVIQEFSNVALTKFTSLVTPLDVHVIIDEQLGPICHHAPDPAFYLRALHTYKTFGLQYYDALIVQAALDMKCRVLYSEDMQHERTFGTLQVVNPFL